MKAAYSIVAPLMLVVLLSGCGSRIREQNQAALQEKSRAQLMEANARIAELQHQLDQLGSAKANAISPSETQSLLNGRWKFLVNIEADAIRGIDQPVQELLIDGNSWKWLVDGSVIAHGEETAQYDFSATPHIVTRTRFMPFVGQRTSRGIFKVDSDHLILTLTPLEDTTAHLAPIPESFAPYGTNNSEYLLERVGD